METVSESEFVVSLSVSMCHCLGGFAMSVLHFNSVNGRNLLLTAEKLRLIVNRCWHIIALIYRNTEAEM